LDLKSDFKSHKMPDLAKKDSVKPMKFTACFLLILCCFSLSACKTLHKDHHSLKKNQKPALPKAPPTPWYIHDLISDDKNRRQKAESALYNMGDKAVIELTKALKHKKPWIRRTAAYLLAKQWYISSKHKAIPALIKSLSDEDGLFRGNVYSALYSMGMMPIPALIQAYKEERDLLIKCRIIEVMGKIMGGSAARFKRGFEEKKNRAYRKKLMPKVVELLERALKNKNQKIQSQAISTLGRLGENASKATPKLVKMLKESKDLTRRQKLLLTLQHIKSTAHISVPIAMRLLHDKELFTRLNAIEFMSRMGPKAIQALPILIKFLRNKNIRIQRNTIIAIGNMGPKAQKAIPVLIKQLQNKNHSIRERTVEAIGKIGCQTPKKCLHSLKKALQDKNCDVRKRAAETLGHLAAKARSAIPELLKNLQDKCTDAASQAAQALGEINREHNKVVSSIVNITKLFHHSFTL